MPHSPKITRGKTKIFTPHFGCIGRRKLNKTPTLRQSRDRPKGKAPFRGPSTLLPLDHTLGATGESSAQLVERLPSVTLDKSECFTIKAVSAQGVPAVLAGRPREVRVEGITPLLGLLIEGAEGVDGY